VIFIETVERPSSEASPSSDVSPSSVLGSVGDQSIVVEDSRGRENRAIVGFVAKISANVESRAAPFVVRGFDIRGFVERGFAVRGFAAVGVIAVGFVAIGLEGIELNETRGEDPIQLSERM